MARLAWTLGLLFAVASCTSAAQVSDTDFWNEAESEPMWEFEPARLLPRDVTDNFDEFDATVVEQANARRTGADFTLDLQSAAGDKVAVHYRLGRRRPLPVHVGEHLHVAMWHRFAPPTASDQPREVAAQGLILTLRGDTVEAVPVTLMVMNIRGGLPDAAMPDVLTKIVPSDQVAWQTGERTAHDCYVAEAHQLFVVGESGRARKVKAPMAAPGSRVRLWDGQTTFDVVLIDNRRVVETTCQPPPKPWWGWVALWTPDKGREFGPERAPDRQPPQGRSPERRTPERSGR